MSSKHVVAIVLVAIAASAQTGNSRASLSVRHFVAPAYPVTACLARIQGTAVAEVAIKSDGAVDSVKVISAHPMYQSAAVLPRRKFEQDRHGTFQRKPDAAPCP
ncbi:MAG: hypothetical protein JWO91_3636 [Acidobacteriaceae bacterium]|nr:hypothetical protein [Acidobacteriaceae bacterium]